jgi:hypothetical protein
LIPDCHVQFAAQTAEMKESTSIAAMVPVGT